MKRRFILSLTVALALLPIAQARAEPPVSVQIEVSFLLGFVEGSGCEFYRNGTWHDSKAAQAHLRDKYRYLVARNLVNSAEDFIENAASKSSLTGLAYEARCPGSAAITSNQWLRGELARLRTYK